MAIAAHALPRAPVEEQLRRLITLPATPLGLSVEFDPEHGITLWDPFDPRKAITEALKDATGAAERDPLRAIDLAEAYLQTGDATRARQLRNKARALAEQELSAAGSARLAALARVFLAAGEVEEAETICRRALGHGSVSAETLVAAGGVYRDCAMALLRKSNSLRQPLRGRLDAMAHRPPSFELRERANRLLAEAANCHEQAFKKAPENAEALLKKAMFLASRSMIERALDGLGSIESRKLPVVILPPEAVSALNRAAELAPENVHIVSLAAILPTLARVEEAIVEQLSTGIPSRGCWPGLSMKARENAAAAISRLQQLRSRSDDSVRVAAAERLAVIQTILFGHSEALSDQINELARRSEAPLILHRLALASAEERGAADEALRAADEWLAKEPSPTAEYARARALTQLGRKAEAVSTLQSALRRSPNDGLLNFGYAAALMMDESSFWRAREPLSKAHDAIRAGIALSELRVLQSIYFALSGDHTTARRILESLARDPASRKHAEAALELIGI
ncbi:MAG TPA: hypothetical protein VEH27_13790 [Methylomirabilota bacterium]|nr:hypothetical protein [Methylomirabilota bacterium]